MAIILLISRPFPAALDLVRLIAFPMIIMNALGMVVFLGTFNMVFMEEDSQFAEKMRLAMGIVDQSLPHLRKGLYSTADMEAHRRHHLPVHFLCGCDDHGCPENPGHEG